MAQCCLGHRVTASSMLEGSDACLCAAVGMHVKVTGQAGCCPRRVKCWSAGLYRGIRWCAGLLHLEQCMGSTGDQARRRVEACQTGLGAQTAVV